MAVKQVTAQFMGQTYTLTYNSATRKYEASLTATKTSYNEPDGYFIATVTATGDSGQSDTASGVKSPGLRLTVEERVAPVVSLVSPEQGILDTNAFTVTFSATDESGGSGLDASTAKTYVDGVSLPCTTTQSSGIITIKVQLSNLTEGAHNVSAAIADNDGNVGHTVAAYIVDTVPPELWIDRREERVVVDVPTTIISGRVTDATTGVVSLTVGGADVPIGKDGKFSVEIPLEIGGNHITVTAKDQAGLASSDEVYRIRLITDRTQSDVDALKAWEKRPSTGWSAAEWEEFYKARARGGYNYTDMNRVAEAVTYLTKSVGDIAGKNPDTDPRTWDINDIPPLSALDRYRKDVESIRETYKKGDIPQSMERLDYNGANQLEAALVAVNDVLPMLAKSFIPCGVFPCGFPNY